MLEAAQKAAMESKEKGGAEPDLGTFLHSGELPHAQASCHG